MRGFKVDISIGDFHVLAFGVFVLSAFFFPLFFFLFFLGPLLVCRFDSFSYEPCYTDLSLKEVWGGGGFPRFFRFEAAAKHIRN